jgi:hypothetical protein
LKTHARNFTIGAVLVPIALAIATLIANEAQTLLGLHLERVALAVYILPFLVGVAMVLAALLRLEGAKVGGELGNILGDLADSLFKPETAAEAPRPAPWGPGSAPALPPSASAPLDPPPAP